LCHGISHISKKAQYPVGQVADSTENNWVNNRAPTWSRPYLRLSRIDRPIGTWLLLIPCWWSVLLAIASEKNGFQPYDYWIIFGCGLGAMLMRGAGCTWNDLMDKDFDALVERTKSRPLPSKQISTNSALWWMVIQAICAFFILISFNKIAILVGVFALLPATIYPFAKRVTWWPQIFLGLAFNWGALLAWVAHTGFLSYSPVFLYISGIFWTLFYDTIYAHQDKEDDVLIGIKSTALLLRNNTIKWLTAFIILSVLFYITAILSAFNADIDTTKIAISIMGALTFGGHMVWQTFHLNINDRKSCLKLFRSNRNAGLLPLVFLLVCILL
jgi:4-hydroxybenzoate polyprenyltransferase